MVKQTTTGATSLPIDRHVEARTRFSRLLLETPDYFKKQLVISGNTQFEEVTCVGLNPDQHTLYAVIEVKQDIGYGGNLCSGPGAREYVRFFVDWDGDGNFGDPNEDVGVASVAVHDIAGPKPLCYVASVTLTADQELCFLAHPRAVRAVLMYNAVPPAGDPSPWIVWGNTLDVNVQRKTRHLLLGDLLHAEKITLKADLAKLVDVSVPVAAPKPVAAAELVQHYAAKVPLHRQLAAPLAKLKAQATVDASHVLSGKTQLEPLLGSELVSKIDVSQIIGAFLDLDGDTTYEQVDCVGLHPDLSAVVAVIQLKQGQGYSGGLCTDGSLEYVAFWADWDNSGSYDQYLGTAAVRVHDEPLPAGGLRFAVFLPVNLAPHRRPCDQSPTARIRAVLSWNTPPSSTNPYAVPPWGNHTECLVQLPTGQPVVGQVPFISVVGGMAIANIDPAGFATGTAVMAGFSASTAPFARMVSIAGHISNPPDLSAGQAALSYGLKYRRDGDPTVHDMADTFQITLTQFTGFNWTQTQMNQVADPITHRYVYREDLSPNGPGGDLTFIEGFILGKWQTLGLVDDRYEIWMEADIGSGTVESNHIFVRLDNTVPVATLAIAGNPFVHQNGTLAGTFTATDDHFGSFSLGILPSFPTSPAPSGGVAPQPPGTPWSLSIGTATPGGYVLQLNVVDRSIVDSGWIGLWSTDSKGFCVEMP